MNKGIYTFLASKGISYTETSNPYDLLLNMDDAEEFLKIATKEHIAIIGAFVFEKRSKSRYQLVSKRYGKSYKKKFGTGLFPGSFL